MSESTNEESIDLKVARALTDADSLIDSLVAERDDVAQKLAAVAEDRDAASEKIREVVDKLAAVRVGHQPLISANLKQRYIEAMEQSKHACVDLTLKVFDEMQKVVPTKTASAELGDPSDDLGQQHENVARGFGALRSDTIRR